MIELTEIKKKSTDCKCVEQDGIEIEIERLFQEYFNRPYRSSSLDAVCDIFEVAKLLRLNDYNMWIKILKYPTIFEHKLSLIYDTINFIVYGKREMSIENWMSLIDTKCPPRRNPKKIPCNRLPETFDKIDILDTWIKRSNGITDVLFTVYLLSKLVNFSDIEF